METGLVGDMLPPFEAILPAAGTSLFQRGIKWLNALLEACIGASRAQSGTGCPKKVSQRLDFVRDPEYTLRLFNIAVRIELKVFGDLHSVQWVHRWRV